jgi:hypothetical protein
MCQNICGLYLEMEGVKIKMMSSIDVEVSMTSPKLGLLQAGLLDHRRGV